MAEETGNSLVSNETSKSDSPNHAAGKPSASKKVPHYLRTSSGSCHDACKYGHPHVFKDKPIHPPRRRISLPLPEIQIYVDKKVQKAVLSDKPKVQPAKDSAPDENILSRKSPVHDSSKLVKQEARLSTKSHSSDAPKVVKNVVHSAGKPEIASTAKKTVSSKRIPLNPKEKNVSAGPLKPIDRVVKSSSSLNSSMKSSAKKTSETEMGDNPRTSRGFIRKTTPPMAATSPQRTSKVEVKTFSVPKIAGKSLNDHNPRSRTFSKNQIFGRKAEPKEPVEEKIEEKTLHVIETKKDFLSTDVQSPAPLSPESLNSSSRTSSISFTSQEHTDSEADDSISNYNSSADSKEASISLNEGKELTHNNSTDQDPEFLKLKFRKGKVVEPKHESNSPRRLRFRKGRSLGDGQTANGESRRKSYRKKGTDSNKKEEETGMVKVVLKHQEMEIKKEEKVLLNNVIEETAIKLVEKRKSKVKALVGAFETVISLQECRPAVAAAAADR
ncbi:uncharacterized protein LOC130801875 [Amaranthus tricolor]|uniref:uncharacterized protein LOC130801875 n=1 Tax=Amaranthus tricolor TaxID=29722 RepID=UPI00258668C7|nr:uncharacterized protein LOC130801875 [Amaranthus tricolor]XP_057521793.1 uncharacterized protein LOC130801875 [Amaranthus tricolor]